MSIGLENILAIAFIVFLSLFLLFKKKNLKIHKLIFPILYAAMYRTKLGLKAMDSVASKGRKFLKIVGVIGIYIGFLGMAFLAFMLIQNVINLFLVPGTVQGAAPVLPFNIKGVFYVPFFYWIISIFIIALIHEFSHGVIARVYNLKIKSSGFAFLCLLIPVLPAAFVEPDEKELQKRPAKQQLSIFAAGPFSNILLGFIVLGLLILIVTPLAPSLYTFDGVEIVDFIKPDNQTYPAEAAGIAKGEIIQGVNGQGIQFLNNLTKAMENASAGDIILLKTDKGEYSFTLKPNPQNETQGYMGIYLRQKVGINESFEGKYSKPFTGFILWIIGGPGKPGLLYWLYFLSLGIGLFNLVPIGPIDGGRMFHLALRRFFKKERAFKIWKYMSGFFLALILFILFFGFLR